ncbi:hypothetical protein BGZ95_007758 [Linnemannia exigua]|uniref:Uncharacterized protein n=1 Tax=Linnemannia exigua TaxID=604196 RepID=A0AAD4DER8_9FUNG|nr:hypothetical protein BGZ95_007758 [Linnemannia exigua]
MMLIVFLQNMASPAILSRLQQSRLRSRRIIDGYDCSYDSTSNYRPVVTIIRTRQDNSWSIFATTLTTPLTMPARRSILVSACSEIAASIHQRALGRTRDPSLSRFVSSIFDPFITGRNLAGNCSRDNVNKIRDCFRSA